MPLLKTIYFVQNKISKISGLDSLVNLTSLELGGNKIRVSETFESISKLQTYTRQTTENRRLGSIGKSGGALVGQEQDHQTRGEALDATTATIH